MKQPNIIFIFLDDMGWKDLACTGSTFYETPRIDQLCREGMIFPNAYAACPVCSPSRASFMTGQYPARVGITDWIDHSGTFHPLRGKLLEAPYLKHLPQNAKTVAQALHDGGYATWHVGKWHLGGREYFPEHFGFEKNIGGCRLGHPHKGYFSPYQIETLPDGFDGEYLTDRLTDEAIRLIHSSDQRPFFLNFCHYAVHTPIEAKEADIAYFTEKARRQGLDQMETLVEGEEFHTEDKKGRHVLRRVLQSDPTYAAMIWNLDQNVGRLVDALQEAGKADNTMLVFTSDNGGLSTSEGSPTCNLPASEGKGWMYEGGVRVPLFVWYPKLVKAGTACRDGVTTPDFFPTFLEAAGLPLRPEEHCDGRSFLPLLEGKAMEERPLFWHYPHYGNQGGTPGSSVVLGKYKLIQFFEGDQYELYDLTADFSEKRNIVAEQPQVAEKLKELLHYWQEDVTAKFPTPVSENGTIVG